MRLSRYFLLLLCFFSLNISAEERTSFGFLSGLQRLGTSVDQE